MDKKKSIGGIVLFGLGLLVLALGFYIMLTIIGTPSHESGTLLRVLLGLFFFICGLVSTITGGIMIYINRKS
jgi:hypothetical protein